LRAGHQCFADRLERFHLRSRQRVERNILGMCFTWREQHLGAANTEGERVQRCTLHQGAPLDLGHNFLSGSVAIFDYRSCGVACAGPPSLERK
jgi:hypothetical protein